MGNAPSLSSLKKSQKPKNKTGTKVKVQKLEHATKTGILSLQELKLKQIPPDTYRLTKLKTLDTTGNSILSYPEDIKNFTQLKTLRLDRNNLTSLPYLNGLPRLVTLSASANRLDRESLLELPRSLTKLNLSRNAFSIIPRSISNLSLLQVLDMSGCQFEIFPHPMVGLSSLSELILDDNQIQTVPSDVIHFYRLTILSLKRNEIRAKVDGIQSMSAELFTDTGVERLHLDGNPLTQGELMEMKGFDTFLERRKKLKQKELQGGVTNFSLCGLD